MSRSERLPSPVHLYKPSKPVNEMTDAEIDAWANQVYEAFVAACKENEADASS
jgi:hypothetical protein